VFNLLVNGTAWEASSGSISTSRVLEYTSAAIRTHFMSGGGLDINKVLALPTVFACETAFDNSQPSARIGNLTRVRVRATEYQLEYVLDPALAPIPNATLKELAGELDIDVNSSIHEFTRNHWAIKDADLFKALLRNNRDRREKPRLFNLGDAPVDESLVALMMPFDAKFDPVHSAIVEAVDSAGMRAQRADDIWNHDHVIQDVVDLISKAKVVICDLTSRNPNVFYEMGIAHTLGRDVIMLTQTKADIPFDVSHLRYISYLANSQGLQALSLEVKKRLDSIRVR
jgi:hypothetical protein